LNPTFNKYGVTITGGSTAVIDNTYPGTDPAGPYRTTGNIGAELKESLDVEWAHAIAPKVNIVLIEADSPGNIYYAVAAVNSPGGVNAVHQR